MKDFVSRIEPKALEIEPRLRNIDVRLDQVMDFDKDTAFLSGSVTEGLHNDRSDVDIYIPNDAFGVVTDMSATMPHDHEEYYQEVNILSRQWIAGLSRRLNQVSRDNFDEVRAVDDSELFMYYRVAIGEPIINPEIFRAFASEFKKEQANEIREARQGLLCQDALKRSQAMLQEDDTEAAYFHALEAIDFALESFLAGHGEGYPHVKFRFDKLARILDKSSEIYRGAWKLRSLGSLSFEDYVQSARQFCCDLGMERFRVASDTTPRYRSSPDTYLVNVMEGYLVSDVERIFQPDEYVRCLWPLFDGLPTKEALCSHLCTTYDISFEHGMAITEGCLKELQDWAMIEVC